MMNPIRILKYYAIRIFRIKASAEDVSLGLAIGFIPNWYPTFGTGPALSVILAKIFRGNLISAFFGGLSGTLFWPFMFYLNYKVGGFILRLYFSLFGNVAVTSHLTHLHLKSETIGLKFVLGAVINTVCFSLLIYFISLFFIRKYRVAYLKFGKRTNNHDNNNLKL